MKKGTENDQTALARKEELIVKELPDEVLVYDLKRDKAHCLNRTAAFVWNHCDGRTSADEIARLMEKEWRTPVSEDAVWFTLNKLSKAELLEERIVLPESKAGMSRRSAVRRLGFGALVAVPMVMSIVAPTAMAGASVPAPCQACIKKNANLLQCPDVCLAVVGQCFDNAGCGQGGALNCQTCAACAGLHGGADTVSWQAPGGC